MVAFFGCIVSGHKVRLLLKPLEYLLLYYLSSLLWRVRHQFSLDRHHYRFNGHSLNAFEWWLLERWKIKCSYAVFCHKKPPSCINDSIASFANVLYWGINKIQNPDLEPERLFLVGRDPCCAQKKCRKTHSTHRRRASKDLSPGSCFWLWD